MIYFETLIVEGFDKKFRSFFLSINKKETRIIIDNPDQI